MNATKVTLLSSLLNATLVLICVLSTTIANAATVGDIRSTKHNLSVSGSGSVNADSETQVCVFCHTPHAATSGQPALWNRTVATTYTRYTSSSLDANNIANGFNAQPGGSSLLCLSCHDGQVALGNVNVLNGQANAAINVNGSTNTKMPVGSYGSTTGYTRYIGENLTNDHPISITFNEDLADADKELMHMDSAQSDVETGGDIIGIPKSGNKPLLPLEPTGANGLGQVQCATCHDPHLFDANDPNRKFLRMNRLQTNAAPQNDNFNPANDMICLACHKKSYASWGESAHAQKNVADEVYQDDAATLREFPLGTQVWQAGCLNCHDTHTVQGSRRLLREGVDTGSSGSGSGSYKQGVASGTSSAIENTCYQCHSNTLSGKVLKTGNGTVPNIKTEFERPYSMALSTNEQAHGSVEVHDIEDGDMIENTTNLGRYNHTNRHAECTDCHNPHRVRRNSTFAGVSDNLRTHKAGGPQGNIASGVLRGTWGVEPTFARSSSSWPTFPINFTVKKGDPGNATLPTSRSESQSASHLTREYQLCFKCHSNYSNGESPADFPLLGNATGTSRGTNGLQRYTNVAAEFGSVLATDPATSGTDQGEHDRSTVNKGTACGGGDCDPASGTTTGNNPSGGNYNHRSWHPVVFPTGRDGKERGFTTTGAMNFRTPFKENLGTQTMHCSDCHGQSTAWNDGTGPDASKVQGPHGSNDPFLLRGTWSTSTTTSNYSSHLCGNCHDPRASSGGTALYGRHIPDDKMNGYACMNCHIALPHGWKNKAFLVNLRCVGPEDPSVSSECASKSSYTSGSGYSAEPYYNRAYLRVSTWRRSSNWNKSACGGGSMEDCRD